MTKEITIYNKLFNVKKEGIKLQRDTKAFNYKYATLDQIQEKLGPILEKETLLVTHSITEGNVVTQVTDISSGDFARSSIPLREGTKPQDKGSEITYYRRYNLVCLFDLEVEDDDGKKAQESGKKPVDHMGLLKTYISKQMPKEIESKEEKIKRAMEYLEMKTGFEKFEEITDPQKTLSDMIKKQGTSTK